MNEMGALVLLYRVVHYLVVQIGKEDLQQTFDIVVDNIPRVSSKLVGNKYLR